MAQHRTAGSLGGVVVTEEDDLDHIGPATRAGKRTIDKLTQR